MRLDSPLVNNFLLSNEDNGSILLATIIVIGQYACNCYFFLYNSNITFLIERRKTMGCPQIFLLW